MSDETKEHSYPRGFYNVEDARNDREKYQERLRKEQFTEAAKTEMFDDIYRKIQDAANEGFSQITIYPVDAAEYDKFYEENPTTLGPKHETTVFTLEQQKVVRAFEELGFAVAIHKNDSYKPLNMPSMANGGWVYQVEKSVIRW